MKREHARRGMGGFAFWAFVRAVAPLSFHVSFFLCLLQSQIVSLQGRQGSGPQDCRDKFCTQSSTRGFCKIQTPVLVLFITKREFIHSICGAETRMRMDVIFESGAQPCPALSGCLAAVFGDDFFSDSTSVIEDTGHVLLTPPKSLRFGSKSRQDPKSLPCLVSSIAFPPSNQDRDHHQMLCWDCSEAPSSNP